MGKPGPHFGFPGGFVDPELDRVVAIFNDQAADGAQARFVHLRYSDDEGDTWVDGRDIYEGGEANIPNDGGGVQKWKTNNQDGNGFMGCGGMCTRSGVWVVTGFQYQVGGIKPTPAVWRSVDKGANWRLARSFDVYGTPWLAGFPGNGAIYNVPGGAGFGNINGPAVEIIGGEHDGHLVSAMTLRQDVTSTLAGTVIILSRDEGLNWEFYSQVINADTFGDGNTYQESCLEILDDGSWYVSHRVNSDYRAYQRSFDNGITWTNPIILPGRVSARPNVIQLSTSTVGNDFGDMLMFHRQDDFQRLLTMSVSHDRGSTYTDPEMISRSDWDTPGKGGRSAYAQPFERWPGLIYVIFAMEFTQGKLDYPAGPCNTYLAKITADA